jgi:hypothetical protein
MSSGGPAWRKLGRSWRSALPRQVPPPARRLAATLDDPATARPQPGSDEAVLAEAAGRLPFVAVRATPEFRTALHDRLLEEPSPVPPRTPLPVVPPDEPPVDLPQPRARREIRPGVRIAVIAAVVGLALLGGATAAVAASGDALPGSPLYAAKRSVEQVQLAFTFEKVARGERLLELADLRVDEAEELLARDGSAALSSGDIEAVNEALSGAHRRVVEADDVLLTAYRLSGDAQPAQSLGEAAQELHDRLVALPPAAAELEANSAALVATLEQVLLRTSSVSANSR